MGSSFVILGSAHGEAGGSGPASVTCDTTGADWVAICCHGVSGGTKTSQHYTDSKNGRTFDPILALGDFPSTGVSLDFTSTGRFADLGEGPLAVGTSHTFTAGANSFYSGIDVVWGSGSWLSSDPYNGDVAQTGDNTTAQSYLASASITPSYDGSLVLLGAMMSDGSGGVNVPDAGWTMDQGHSSTSGTAIGGLIAHLIEGAKAAASATPAFNSDTGAIWNIIASFRPASFSSGGGSTFTLTAEQATYSLTGEAAGLERNRTLVAAFGSCALNGEAADLKAPRKLPAQDGAYALTGLGIGLLAGRILVASTRNYGAGTYGSNIYGAGAKGSYVLTGEAVAFATGISADFSLAAGQGTFTMAGEAAGLAAGRKAFANAGAFLLTGESVGDIFGLVLRSGLGSFVLSGGNTNSTRAAIWTPENPAGESWASAVPEVGIWTPQAGATETWTTN